jgi:hypothetical protein
VVAVSLTQCHPFWQTIKLIDIWKTNWLVTKPS